MSAYSPLLQVIASAGIGWTLARTWEGTRQRERQLKRQGGASRRCPICRARAAAGDTSPVAGRDLQRHVPHPAPMTAPPLPAATTDLWQLLARYHQLQHTWRDTHTEPDRLAMVRSWGIFITHPGGNLEDGAGPGTREICTPTVLSRDTGNRDAHLAYRGACLGCGWISPHTHLIRAGGGRRRRRRTPTTTPTPAGGSCRWSRARPRRARQARTRTRWPAGATNGNPSSPPAGSTAEDRSAPLAPHGPRHVPGGAPGGGYDLSAGDTSEQPCGQLGLFSAASRAPAPRSASTLLALGQHKANAILGLS